MKTVDDYRILVVDDIDDNRFTLDLMLSELGDFVVDEAESGAQALGMMQQNTYDLVLLDIMMPGMTGLEVLEELDLAHTGLTTKFIVVSALQDMQTIVKALELGALDYLPKPIEESILAARLQQLLERRETDLALEHHRARIDADLKKASEIQLSLCPKQTEKLFHNDEVTFEFSGTMRPAYEVGGDFFDYFVLPNGNYVLVVADACGKGAPAAIYATRVHDVLRVIARNQTPDTMADAKVSLGHMLGEVNTILSEDNEDCWFVTAWIGILEPEERRMTWCSAGHCEAMLQADSSIEILSAEVGLPLGLGPQVNAQINSRVLNSGEVVYVYTDGITEHRLVNGEFIGITGLEKVLLEQPKQDDLSEAVSSIADKVEGCNPELQPVDDITLLAVKIH